MGCEQHPGLQWVWVYLYVCKCGGCEGRGIGECELMGDGLLKNELLSSQLLCFWVWSAQQKKEKTPNPSF